MTNECIPIWIEVNGRGAANAFALNTSYAMGRGESVEQAIDNLKGDMAGIRKWLASHGFEDDRPIDRPFRIVQTMETLCDPHRGKSIGFFDWDEQLLTEDQIDEAEHILHCSRSDLLSLITPASDAMLDIKLAPKTRSIREISRHIAARELWYGSCLLDEPRDAPMIHEFGNNLRRRLDNVRLYFQDSFLDRVRKMNTSQRMRQQLQDRELWSARKALRSAVQHEIYHLKQVYRMMTRIRRLPDKVRQAAVA
ncbi:MAG: hypothetical protein O7G85_16405 [Planctomycetota bacterium]|nr:hypothetical protein [Planctomycetota bacterium]